MKSFPPLLIVLIVLSALSALIVVHQYWPAAVIWIGAASALGMIVRAFQVEEGQKSARSARGGGVDHVQLRRKDFLGYEGWLKENVRGHDAAVAVVAKTIHRGLQLSQPGRSLGSFLLVGPTGTGKTFLALMASKALWPDKEPVLLRMNQCKDPSDVRLLLGAAGAEEEGLLAKPVLDDPHRVVILDEIDKCHPEVLHCLFDALDGGRCRDKVSGQILDFSGCVFFATCNAGTESLRSIQNLRADTYVARARDILAREAGFDKAFLARFTEILLLDSLPVINVAEIACLLIAKQAREQGLEIAYVSPEFLARLVAANNEFSQYGVRQLAHCLRRMTDPLVEQARRVEQRRICLGIGPTGEPALVAGPAEGVKAER